MKTYTLPVSWYMASEVEVKANSLEEAIEKAYEAELPEGEYIYDSFEVQHDFIEDDES